MLIEPFNFNVFSITDLGIDLNYGDIEWFALEMNRECRQDPRPRNVWLTGTNGSSPLEELTAKSRVLTEGTESV